MIGAIKVLGAILVLGAIQVLWATQVLHNAMGVNGSAQISIMKVN